LNAEAPADEHREAEGRSDGDQDEPERLGPDQRDRGQIHAQAEEDDAQPQDDLDREPDAGHGPRRRAADVDQDQPQEHGQRNLEADRERIGEGQLGGQVGGQADGSRQEESRQ
jgi:hypothetical protein